MRFLRPQTGLDIPNIQALLLCELDWTSLTLEVPLTLEDTWGGQVKKGPGAWWMVLPRQFTQLISEAVCCDLWALLCVWGDERETDCGRGYCGPGDAILVIRPKVRQPCLSLDCTQEKSEWAPPSDAFLGLGTKEWAWAHLPFSAIIHSFIHTYTQQ